MSTTVRWILAILLVLFGITAGALAVFGGAFSTVACVKDPPSWVYNLLYLAGTISLAACVVPAVLLLRRTRGAVIIGTFVLGIVLACAGYGGYLAVLGQNC